MGNNPLYLCLSMGASVVLVSEVILGCFEALKFSCGNNLSIHSLIFNLETSLPCRAPWEMERVRLPHPCSLGNILLAHGSSSGCSQLPEHHSTALQCRTSPTPFPAPHQLSLSPFVPYLGLALLSETKSS